jgi:conjugal transfer pilus assembly protein TraL
MSHNTYIPRRLNDAWKIAWFEIDVAIPWAGIFVLGLLAGHWFIGIAMATIVARAIMKVKSDKHPAFLLHWAYWYLPELLSKMKRTPPSHIREMIG